MMKSAFLISLLLSAVVGNVSSATVSRRLSCPEASRFGNPTITPQGPFAPGDAINISVDLTCAVENFGIIPQFIDYTIEVPSSENNGHEQPIVLGRHAIPAGALSDSISAHIPHQFLFANAPYQIVTTAVYPENDTDGTLVLLEGSVEIPITINVPSTA